MISDVMFHPQLAAETMVSQLLHWIRVDDSGLGVDRLPGAIPSQELGRPMMLLNVLSELCGEDRHLRDKYGKEFEWSIQEILKHVRSVPSVLDESLG